MVETDSEGCKPELQLHSGQTSVNSPWLSTNTVTTEQVEWKTWMGCQGGDQHGEGVKVS
jgi:hypothetical protein